MTKQEQQQIEITNNNNNNNQRQQQQQRQQQSLLLSIVKKKWNLYFLIINFIVIGVCLTNIYNSLNIQTLKHSNKKSSRIKGESLTTIIDIPLKTISTQNGTTTTNINTYLHQMTNGTNVTIITETTTKTTKLVQHPETKTTTTTTTKKEQQKHQQKSSSTATETATTSTTESTKLSSSLVQDPQLLLQQQLLQQQRENKEQKYHILFSTSCSNTQTWASYLLFHSAYKVKQPGSITRIVSGCNETQQIELQKEFDETIKKPMTTPMTSFHIHFAPDPIDIEYDAGIKKYWNRPFGLKHWMETILGYTNPNNNYVKTSNILLSSTSRKLYEANKNNQYNNDIFIILDPDMIFNKPIINDFSDHSMKFWIDHYSSNKKTDDDIIQSSVRHGLGIAQVYAYGNEWLKFLDHNLTYILQTNESPLYDLSDYDAKVYYPSGAPYMLTTYDMYKVVLLWCDLMPRIFTVKNTMHADMYSYNMATAHLNIKQQLSRGLMVSNIYDHNNEKWDFISDVQPKDICDTATTSTTTTTTTNNEYIHQQPYVLHHCQRYSIGNYFYSKYKTHHDIFSSCNEPLYALPPKDSAIRYNYSKYGDGSIILVGEKPKKSTTTIITNDTSINKEEEEKEEQEYHSKELHYRNAYFTCTALSALNNAGIFYKENNCNNKDDNTNYNTTWNFNNLKKEGKLKVDYW